MEAGEQTVHRLRVNGLRNNIFGHAGVDAAVPAVDACELSVASSCSFGVGATRTSTKEIMCSHPPLWQYK